MMTRHVGAGLAAALCGALFLASPASAGQLDNTSAGSTGNGYQVAVTFTGDAAPSGGTTRTVSVRAACWWAPAEGPYTDAAAMLAWFEQNVEIQGDTSGYYQTIYGQRQIWEQAAKAEKGGTDLSWYRATCRNPADYAKFNAGTLTGGPNQLTLLQAFPVGQPLPAPLVDPADLARAARDVMVIPVPVTNRNPKINSAGDPTLVGLPTWFWVTDPASVGGAGGTRTIRASVGNVWAEVTARTSGLELTSPAGGASCPTKKALTAYADGVPDSSACTVEFARASVAYPKGYPVAATTNWDANWQGSDGNGGGLNGLARTVIENVPVAEVQNVVTGSG